MAEVPYEKAVFVNCPFDDAYRALFEALIFAVIDCGYEAHCALETDDGSEVRIEKIAKIISECRLGIHDISRTEPDMSTGLPRFNMPFELGMFLGAKRYGHAEQRRKNCLILDIERYRYQKFISDIAGQDIASHQGEPQQAIRIVRDWLSNAAPGERIPAGRTIAKRFELFREVLLQICEEADMQPDELTFNDYVVQVQEWLDINAHTAN
ncbi:MAG TPA: hypothetical protein VGQ76_04185 [Thermoanaerobaculia bacterium]|jgi:hypothetical protein|nr:hypothetical protein [Thermoanaerobaculia bacterium]